MKLVFCDSSILLENIKNKNFILDKLIEGNNILLINTIVNSEFLYHLLSIEGDKSQLNLKNKKQINEILKKSKNVELINEFEVLNTGENTCKLSLDLMKKHNLLPNDAIILANCIENNIDYIATLDEDLMKACKKERINLIS